jgi:hypothetical protein
MSLAPAFSTLTLPESAQAAKPAVARPKKPAADPYADAILVDGAPPKIALDSFTIVVLPDTQKYAANNPDGYLLQTEWIAREREARNIACVLHLGDITDHNEPAEWNLAAEAMHRLDGHVPYFMVLGNHDYSQKGACADRTTRFNEYFPLAIYSKLPTFGGTYDREPDRLENSYHLFSAGGRDFLALMLEFGPRNDVVRWANEVAAKHRDRAAILVTHAYMYYDDSRYDWSQRGKDQKWNPHSYKVAANTADDVNDGEALWQKLVSQHENFILTLNGHVIGDGLGRTATQTRGGRTVHQMLVNFQMKPRGADGWLRLLEFRADGQTVDVCDYSPTRNQCNKSAQNRFTIQTSGVSG